LSLETSVSELKRELSSLINQAAYGKERIVIMSRGRPKAALVSMEDLHVLEGMNQQEIRRASRMAALEAARTVRAQVAAETGGSLPDSAPDLRELREARADELDSMC
jgi:prevent-host-death family protein